ncbi:acyltransferase [Chloroflexia bacterium SDU3-3]|nr:acyltransferase [Chloroflexia bacterium SDU3-3]
MSNPPPAPARLHYLDGMRALAALAVVALHTMQMYDTPMDGVAAPQLPLHQPWAQALYAALLQLVIRLGSDAVPVFLVLSGFSLMLPAARAGDGRLPGGVGRFFLRRARRILPPYYAAVLLAFALIAAVPWLAEPRGLYWDLALPATWQALLAHLLLVHNASYDWYLKINPPLWSIAVETQIYLLFPLLLWVWRKWGTLALAAAALGYGVVANDLPIPLLPLSQGNYVCIFGMGMAAAAIGFAPGQGWLRRLPWPLITLGAAAAYAAVCAASIGRLAQLPGYAPILVAGASMASGMVAMALREQAGRPAGLVRRALERPALVGVGRFSYSIYLIHAPLLALAAAATLAWGMPARLAYPALALGGWALVLAASYGFYRLIELPSMGRR